MRAVLILSALWLGGCAADCATTERCGAAKQAPECGPGTHAEDGTCVADESVACGTGTVLVDGTCVPEAQVDCGEGTVLVDGECVPESEVDCGEGTVLVDGECVPESEVDCGEGTVLVDGECVPEDSLACGPGTLRVGDACVPESSLECGPGTVQEGDTCVPEAEIDCGEGTILDGDTCVPAALQHVVTPLPQSALADVIQGHNSNFSHTGFALHAVDFAVPEGTEVAAARAGVVVRTWEESDSGCDDPSCSWLANYVMIDHGDGTLASYWHLQQHGALVEVGEQVDRGQIIGLSGNTGWSNTPHLHFEITDLLGRSLPLRFEELEPVSDGVAWAGLTWLSDNTHLVRDDDTAPSTCPEDLYLHMGVWLDPDIPCSLAPWGEPYLISGNVAGDADRVQSGRQRRRQRQRDQPVERPDPGDPARPELTRPDLPTGGRDRHHRAREHEEDVDAGGEDLGFAERRPDPTERIAQVMRHDHPGGQRP